MQSSKLHVPVLIFFSAALFAPMMGRGFVQDDFYHLCEVAFNPVSHGLTRATGGHFYAPTAWLSYRLDWVLWGLNSYPYAVTNLLLHVANTILLYILAQRLWQSKIAAWWTAFSFALFFPANVMAVMWIGTRAHILATLFYIAALLATVWLTQTKNKFLPVIAAIVFAALAMFSKESGVTVPAAIAVVIFYQRSRQQKISLTSTLGLFAALFAAFAIYFWLRSQSGAVGVSVSSSAWYTYSLSLGVVLYNLQFYFLRTFGLAALIWLALAVSLRIDGQRPNPRWFRKIDVFFAPALFLIAVAPFAFLNIRSGLYAYLPGMGAALFLGAATRVLETETAKPRRALSFAPIVLIIVGCAAFTIGQSLRWIKMAEVNDVILAQIIAQQPVIKQNTFVTLKYPAEDRPNRFPESFATWAFPFAVRILYGDASLDGRIVKAGESNSIGDKFSEIVFDYDSSGGSPKIIKTTQKQFPSN